MNELIAASLEWIRQLQTTYPAWLDPLTIITYLGREEFYLAVIPIVYWSYDKHVGRHLGYLFLLSVNLNTLLKHALRWPRPFWLDSGVRTLGEAGYGIPSGHAQFSTVLYGYFAAATRRRLVWLVCFVLVALITFSRIYLGEHFPIDAAGGIMVGLLTLLLYAAARRLWSDWFNNRLLGQRLLLAILVAMGLAAIYALVMLLVGPPDLDVAWSAFVTPAELATLEAMALGLGALLGAGAGLVLEAGRVGFRADGPLWKRLLRYLVGITITAAIWLGLNQVFPRQPLWLGLPLRGFRYFATLLWATYYAPMLFVRLKLAEADPPTTLSITAG